MHGRLKLEPTGEILETVWLNTNSLSRPAPAIDIILHLDVYFMAKRLPMLNQYVTYQHVDHHLLWT